MILSAERPEILKKTLYTKIEILRVARARRSAELAHEVIALRVCNLLVRFPSEGEVETLRAGDLVVLLAREVPREIRREAPRDCNLLLLAARLARLPAAAVPAQARGRALEQLAPLEVVRAVALRAVPIGTYPAPMSG